MKANKNHKNIKKQLGKAVTYTLSATMIGTQIIPSEIYAVDVEKKVSENNNTAISDGISSTKTIPSEKNDDHPDVNDDQKAKASSDRDAEISVLENDTENNHSATNAIKEKTVITPAPKANYTLDTPVVFDEVRDIPDSNFRLAIKTAINPKNPNAITLTRENMTSIQKLVWDGEKNATHKITDLTGLKYMPNLGVITLPNNDITGEKLDDIDDTASRDVILTDVDLSGNQHLGNVGAERVAKSSAIRVNLSKTGITSLENNAFSNDTRLLNLDLSLNTLGEVAISGDSSLLTLNLESSAITGNLHLNGLSQLQNLYIRRNFGLSALTYDALNELKVLDASGTAITSIGTNLTKLETLKVNYIIGIDVATFPKKVNSLDANNVVFKPGSFDSIVGLSELTSININNSENANNFGALLNTPNYRAGLKVTILPKLINISASNLVNITSKEGNALLREGLIRSMVLAKSVGSTFKTLNLSGDNISSWKETIFSSNVAVNLSDPGYNEELFSNLNLSNNHIMDPSIGNDYFRERLIHGSGSLNLKNQTFTADTQVSNYSATGDYKLDVFKNTKLGQYNAYPTKGLFVVDDLSPTAPPKVKTATMIDASLGQITSTTNELTSGKLNLHLTNPDTSEITMDFKLYLLKDTWTPGLYYDNGEMYSATVTIPLKSNPYFTGGVTNHVVKVKDDSFDPITGVTGVGRGGVTISSNWLPNMTDEIGKKEVILRLTDNVGSVVTQKINVYVVADDKDIAKINDDNLTKVLNQKLKSTDLEAPIQISKLNGITGILDISNRNITDLTGLEHCLKITQLQLAGNSDIKDFTPISKLPTLTDLNLSNITTIKDLKGFELPDSLPALKTLNLSGMSALTDISAISNFKNLTSLNMSSDGKVSDMSQLSLLTSLQQLDLSSTNINDIDLAKALSAIGSNLKTLKLSKTYNLNDVSSAANALTNLDTIDLNGSTLQNIQFLKGTKLTKLALENMPSLTGLSDSLEDITTLSSLIIKNTPLLTSLGGDYTNSNITELTITNAPVLSDLGAAWGSKSLTTTRLDNVGITTLGNTFTNSNVTGLYITNCDNLSSLGTWRGNISLRTLKIYGKNLQGVGVGMKKLTNLDGLQQLNGSLRNLTLSHLYALTDWVTTAKKIDASNLINLGIYYTNLANLDGFENATESSLQAASINHNALLENINGLKIAPNLKNLYLTANPKLTAINAVTGRDFSSLNNLYLSADKLPDTDVYNTAINTSPALTSIAGLKDVLPRNMNSIIAWRSGLTSLNGLNNVQNIYTLSLQDAPAIRKLDGIESMEGINTFTISGTRINDFSALHKSTNLKVSGFNAVDAGINNTKLKTLFDTISFDKNAGYTVSDTTQTAPVSSSINLSSNVGITDISALLNFQGRLAGGSLNLSKCAINTIPVLPIDKTLSNIPSINLNGNKIASLNNFVNLASTTTLSATAQTVTIPHVAGRAGYNAVTTNRHMLNASDYANITNISPTGNYNTTTHKITWLSPAVGSKLSYNFNKTAGNKSFSGTVSSTISLSTAPSILTTPLYLYNNQAYNPRDGLRVLDDNADDSIVGGKILLEGNTFTSTVSPDFVISTIEVNGKNVERVDKTTQPGIYTQTVSVTNEFGQTKDATREIHVLKADAPVVKGNDTPVIIKKGDTDFERLILDGVSASVNRYSESDPNTITTIPAQKIEIDETQIDINTPNTYQVDITATYGISKTTVQREVTIRDLHTVSLSLPAYISDNMIISLAKAKAMNMNLWQGVTYSDSADTQEQLKVLRKITDNTGKEVTELKLPSTTDKELTQAITYEVTNTDGVKASKTVNITITNHIPEFTLASQKLAADTPIKFIAKTYTDNGFAGIEASDVEDDQVSPISKPRIKAIIKTKESTPVIIATVTDDVQFKEEMNKLTSNAMTSKDYEVEYIATDSDGNESSALTRTICVDTNNAPVLTFDKGAVTDTIKISASQVTEYNGKLTEGILMSDDHDTLDKSDIIVNGSLVKPAPSLMPDLQKITYTIKDSQGNTSDPITRTYMISNTPPTFGVNVDSFIHANPITMLASLYNDNPYSNITATDVEDSVVTIRSTILDDHNLQVAETTTATTGDTLKMEINKLHPGNYKIQYSVTDIDGNTATAALRTLTVQTNNAPTLSFENDSEIINIKYGDIDAYNRKLKDDIKMDDDHDTFTKDQIEILDDNKTLIKPTKPSTTAIEQQFTYQITDSQGNTSNKITRTYRISDQAPVFTTTAITEAGMPITMYKGIYDGNPLLNIEAADAEDAPDAPLITWVIKDADSGSLVKINGYTPDMQLKDAINQLPPKTYIITYIATDKDGNTAALERQLIVNSNEAPVIKFVSNKQDKEEVNIKAGEINTYNKKLKEGIFGTDDHDTIDETKIQIKNDAILTVPAAGDIPERQEIHYYAEDSQGNRSNEITRTYIISNEKPKFTVSSHSNANKKLIVYHNYFAADENPFSKIEATDLEDGTATITAQISGNGTSLSVAKNRNELVNQLKGLSISASYSITWMATDSDGNTTTLVQLVEVVSNDKPILHFVNGSDTIHIKVGEVDKYNTDLLKDDITISDDHDQNTLTKHDIQVQGSLTKPMVSETETSQSIRYTITDNQGNVSDIITRTYWISNQAPKFSAATKDFIQGTPIEAFENVFKGDVFENIEASDLEDGTTSPAIRANVDVNGKIETGSTNEELRTIINKLGVRTTTITYIAKDSDGNEVSLNRKLIIKENTKPILVFENNSETVNLTAGQIEEYNNKHLKENIKINGNIDHLDMNDIEIIGNTKLIKPAVSDTADQQMVSYRITDKRGNVSPIITRTYVISNQAPTFDQSSITLAKTAISTYQGIYTEDVFTGIQAKDKEDGVISDIQVTIKDGTTDIVTAQSDASIIRNEINKLQSGEYTLFYQVIDSDGNSSTLERTIVVLTNKTPILTFTSNNSDNETIHINYGDIAQANADILQGINLEDDHGTTLDGIQKSNNITVPSAPQDEAIIQKITFIITDAQGNTSKPITRTYEISNQAPKFSDEAIAAAKTPYHMRAKKADNHFMDYMQAMDKEDNNSTLGKTPINVSLEKDNQKIIDDLDPQNTNQMMSILDVFKKLDPGNYTLIYTATDNDGNKTILKRETIVETNTAPVFHGLEKIYINAANVEEYNQKLMEGINVSDDHDDLTESVKISGKLTIPPVSDKADIQTIQYTVTDSDGNTTTFMRTYLVVNQLPKFTVSSIEKVKTPIVFIEGKWEGNIFDDIFAETFDPSSVLKGDITTKLLSHLTTSYTKTDLNKTKQEDLNIYNGVFTQTPIPSSKLRSGIVKQSTLFPRISASYTNEDLNKLKPGKYQLVYTATDALDNTAEISREIIVEQKAQTTDIANQINTEDPKNTLVSYHATAKTPDTADSTNLRNLLSLIGVSSVAMFALTYKKKKNKKEK